MLSVWVCYLCSRLVSARSVGSGEEGHPVGTRLTVRYGKGNNQKTYEAKVSNLHMIDWLFSEF
jgi:hypothetical protein